jgi:hypothetical protein
MLAAPVYAHHPGSHAVRQPDGRVKVDAVAMASDSCTSIAALQPGTPPGLRAPQGTEPVVVRLARPSAPACATMVTAVRSDAVLTVPAKATHLHLYIVAPDGQVQASERVPIR